MQALRFTQFGKPEVLRLEMLADPVADPAAVPSAGNGISAAGGGQAVVRIVAASINPSDVKNVAGAMAQTTLPRTPGRDYAGIVESGPAAWVGAEVWGTGGDTGFTRDGSHAEKIVVPVASLRRKPATLDFDQAASVGVNFIAAWRGLVDACGLAAGETVVILGASGGVGNAGVQIARRIGARIIGVDRKPPRQGSAIIDAGATIVAEGADIPLRVRDVTAGRGADVVLDTVGGVMFPHALACLAVGGRVAEMSVTGARQVSFDLADFYHNESRLFGIDTLKLDLTAAAVVLEALAPGFETGAYRAAPISRRLALQQAVSGYQAVVAGEPGRVVLRCQPE